MFRWRKWDGSPHWEHECVFLGSDEWGDWFGQQIGWHSARPGLTAPVEAPNVTLMPPDGTWVLTVNEAPRSTRVYIDIAWDARWSEGEPREPTAIDMDLDVVRRLDERGTYIDDVDEWDEHRVEFGYPLEIVPQLESVAADLEQHVRALHPPFDDATAARWFARLAELTPEPPA